MNDVSPKDIERFLAGELPSDLPEYERIVEDLERPDGVVWQFLAEQRERRQRILDDQWFEVMRESVSASLLPSAKPASDSNGTNLPSEVFKSTTAEIGVPTWVGSGSEKQSPSRTTRRLLAIVSFSTVAAILLLIGVFYLGQGRGVREFSVATVAVASPLRGDGNAGELVRSAGGEYEVSGRDFFVGIKSEQSGWVTVVVQAKNQNEASVFPREGQAALQVGKNTEFRFGPILSPGFAAHMWVIVTPGESTSVVRQWVRTESWDADVAERLRTLRQSLESAGQRAVGLSHLEIAPKQQ